jgi:hypothetical protein
MRSAALAAGLVCAALGLALAIATPRVRVAALGALAIVSVVAAFAAPFAPRADVAFFACWIAVAACACATYGPYARRGCVSAALSSGAGLCVGAVIASAGTPTDLVRALPCALVVVPAAWIARRGGGVASKVATSWLLAVSLLAAALQWVPVTPGYAPDHLD